MAPVIRIFMGGLTSEGTHSMWRSRSKSERTWRVYAVAEVHAAASGSNSGSFSGVNGLSPDTYSSPLSHRLYAHWERAVCINVADRTQADRERSRVHFAGLAPDPAEVPLPGDRDPPLNELSRGAGVENGEGRSEVIQAEPRAASSCSRSGTTSSNRCRCDRKRQARHQEEDFGAGIGR